MSSKNAHRGSADADAIDSGRRIDVEPAHVRSAAEEKWGSDSDVMWQHRCGGADADATALLPPWRCWTAHGVSCVEDGGGGEYPPFRADNCEGTKQNLRRQKEFFERA